ncbi:hypothetical protein CFP75_18640 [Amycolatopsis alba DSM 44262]|uniref:Uncharacterized protein n=1 Tax=Amycolatopsis alba DSM 44262 TaxID=1125972 RepID=A0A229RSG9_AMYAL|nr:hypothetical protein CFP75_18640 [Amycolatopsis alba DSM 44262]
MTCDDVGNADPAVGFHRASTAPAASLTGTSVGVAVATGPRGVVLVGHSVSFHMLASKLFRYRTDTSGS